MKKLRRVTALLLCILMVFPAQSIMTSAQTEERIRETRMLEPLTEDTERIEESMKLEPLEETETGEEEVNERYQETLALEVLETPETPGQERIREMLKLEPLEAAQAWDETLVIYWNPGELPPGLAATASNAQKATGSNAASEEESGIPTATGSNAGKAAARTALATPSEAMDKNAAVSASLVKAGNDRADGRTAQTPVRTLAKAIERAMELQEEEDCDSSQITIYAMNPMEIGDGQLFILNGNHIRIASWPGRKYESDLIFFVNGGQLTLVDVMLDAGAAPADGEDPELIWVHGGTLQIGRAVETEGRIILDYEEESEYIWAVATPSDAVSIRKRNTGSDNTEQFDINAYVLEEEPEQAELVSDTMTASTWRTPIIELLEGFDTDEGNYLLEVRSDDGAEAIEVVNTLYADDTSEQEFLECFRLIENGDDTWSLEADTSETDDDADADTEAGIITRKTLRATRSETAQTIYWNPGGTITIGEGLEYPAGADTGFSGLEPRYPVKSWEDAVRRSRGGTVILMQNLNLGDADAEDSLMKEGEAFILSSKSIRDPSHEISNTAVTLKIWDAWPNTAIIVPKTKTLILEDVILGGMTKDGVTSSTKVVDIQRGRLYIRGNVTAEKGYIQVEAFAGLKDQPVRVTSADGTVKDGMITLLFSGINDNSSYKYMDVVIPDGSLKDEADGGKAAAAAVGKRLLDRFQLEAGNRREGGSSQFDWKLQQDTEFDKDGEYPQNLELYIDLFYNAVYLDGIRGDDDNDGVNCNYPVKSWEKAVEIWKREMLYSLAVRNKAFTEEGMSAAEIERLYPVPDTIYICGTITLKGTEAVTWELPVITEKDFDGNAVVTEVMSHSHNSPEPYDADLHEVPEILIYVTEQASLTLKELIIRNTTNLSDTVEFPSTHNLYGTTESVTVKVDKQGTLKFAGNTVMTGGLAAGGGTETTTRGTHVKLLEKATFLLDTGYIQKRQQGVIARGADVTFTMSGGEIRENNSYYSRDDNAYSWLYGSGVSLQDGVTFTMNGGTIARNQAYPRGAGVYLKENETGSGPQTTFLMKRGAVVENIGVSYIYSSSDRAYGTGIYGSKNTVIEIGTGTSQQGDALVGNNTMLLGDGVGIWTDGDLILDHATISGNNRYKQGSSTYSYACYGTGIYVAANGYLKMNDSWVVDNYTDETTTSPNVLGSGIYLADNKSSSIDGPRTNTITDSFISDNIVRKGSTTGGSPSYNAGGGIYANGKLKIENTMFTGNYAGSGGAVYAPSSSELRISGSTFSGNNANSSYSSGSSGGGAIFSSGKVTLLSGTKVIGNTARLSGGGICMAGGSLRVEGQGPTAMIEISDNTSLYDSGGGIYGSSSGSVETYYVLLKGNSAGNGAGMYLAGTGYHRNLTVTANIGRANGGGAYLAGTQYLTDCEFTDNEALSSAKSGYGGGMYVNGKVYLTEDTDGAFKLTGNKADHGGGIYTANIAVYMNIAGSFKNSATVQGSNLFLAYGNSVVVKGRFLQPDVPSDGVYNIYVSNTYGTFGLQIDLDAVQIEKKTGSKAEAIFLNQTASTLSLLTAPPTNNTGDLPLDLSQTNFTLGLIVVKPANVSSVSFSKVNGNATAPVEESVSYTALDDISSYVKYFSGGSVPRKTQLGSSGVNIVLLGEGVYLSGSGDNNNDGLSPESPVATFQEAKKILEEQITASYNNPDDKDGFTPFIYICGTVVVREDETWILDETLPLFQTMNRDYIDAEMAEEGLTEDQVPIPQVRRYTAFTGHMVQVGDSSNHITLTTGRILMNGMADRVSAGGNSIIYIYTGSDAVLTGNTRVTNSMKNAIYVYDKASLLLTGDPGEINTQLVWNYQSNIYMGKNATLTMRGEACIYMNMTDSLNRSDLLGVETGTYSDGVKVYMYDNSSIVGHTRIATGLSIYGDKSIVELYDNATINSVSNGIFVAGDSVVNLKNESWVNGRSIGIHAYCNKLTTITLSGQAQIRDGSVGAKIGGVATFIMQGNTKITGSYYGIEASGSSNDDIKIELRGYSELIGTYKTYEEVWNNTNSAGECFSGIVFNNSYGGAADLYMTDWSGITGYQSGIHFYRDTNDVTILMDENAAVEQNLDYGVSERDKSYYYYGANKIALTMRGNSRISGNGSHGVYLGSMHKTPESGWKKIILEGNAIIGAPIVDGQGYYDENDARSGNQGYGVYANTPVQMSMSGTSKISGNGMAGIYLTRLASSYYTPGTANIQMTGNSAICDNKGSGIYTTTNSAYYLNTSEIWINGEASGEAPSITGNGSFIYLGTQTTMKLTGDSVIGESTDPDSTISIECYGKLELDGRSTVEGTIYLRTKDHPITMTHKVESSSPQTYSLWMVEAFMDQNVVVPVNLDGLGSGIDNVEDQLEYFIKAAADGLAADKLLRAKDGCIKLQGDNNVYLAGNGIDTNNGKTPSTAVRTFKQAKYLLETGDYTEGANIVICNQTVSVLGSDLDWSFDDGIVVNKSGESWKPILVRYEEYKGRLITVRGTTGYNLTVNFENITIDGGSEKGEQYWSKNGACEMLYIDEYGTAVLGPGAVLQNNKVKGWPTYSTNALGVMVYRGTLELNGGTIRNMVCELVEDSRYHQGGIATAIYCSTYSSTTPPGKVNIKSGLITDNVLSAPESASSYMLFGTILIDRYTGMEMSGAIIENNTVTNRAYVGQQTGTILLCKGGAEISGGIIRNNQSERGSAISYYIKDNIYYYEQQDGGLVISGGQISGNTTNTDGMESTGDYSQIYIAGENFELRGNGADIKDNIYLSNPNCMIKISQRFILTSRVYHVYLKETEENYYLSYFSGARKERMRELLEGTAGSKDDFTKGHVVVQPDGSIVTDATPYYANFNIHTTKYVLDHGRTDLNITRGSQAGAVEGVVERSCLILMKPVYLDYAGGSDDKPGTSPTNAFSTFTKAVAAGSRSDAYQGEYDALNTLYSTGKLLTNGYEDYFIIYISGAAVNTDTETEWKLPLTAYMCRYTGFPFYEGDAVNEKSERAYYGSLIEPQDSLVFDQIAVYGRRPIDKTADNGESIVNIRKGVSVTVNETVTGATIFERNNNMGTYKDEQGIDRGVNSQGGAFRVEGGGSLIITGGTFADTEAAYGSSIYLGGDDTGASAGFYVTGTPAFSGSVYLDGVKSTSAAYLETDQSFVPASPLQIAVGNDYNGRPVIFYRDNVVPGYDQMKYYKFSDIIRSSYDIVNRNGNASMLELSQRHAIYLDGIGGDNDNLGTAPEQAYKTLDKVFSVIGSTPGNSGTIVYVVNTVPITSDNITLNNYYYRGDDNSVSYGGSYVEKEGTTTKVEIEITGQVIFKRYAQPDKYSSAEPIYDGYARPTHMGTLFHVRDSGILTLNGIYVDGHAQDYINIDERLVAEGVEASAPLITVEDGGRLYCGVASAKNAQATATELINNINSGSAKTKELGTLEGETIYEGNAAGIEVLEGGICHLEQTQFTNLEIKGGRNFGGTDVYTNGRLIIKSLTFFKGSVYLEGLGSPVDTSTHDTSRRLEVEEYGYPVATEFQLLMRDKYDGRITVHYTASQKLPAGSDIGYYRLEEKIRDFFRLEEKTSDPEMLVLRVTKAVYVDGAKGNDLLADTIAGTSPEKAVQSLRRAYHLLSIRGGNTIYVVNNPIQLGYDTDTRYVEVTGDSYIDAKYEYYLPTANSVRITRYIQPDFTYQASGLPAGADYSTEDYEGLLLTVGSGAVANFNNHVYFDGHHDAKTVFEYEDVQFTCPEELYVSRSGNTAKAPLVKVESGGTLNLMNDVTLWKNENTYQSGELSTGGEEWLNGGAVNNEGTVNAVGAVVFARNIAEIGGVFYNSGTAVVDDALFTDNQAQIGSAAYQDGTFTIQSAPGNLKDHSFYLTTKGGVDHVLQIAEAIPDEMVGAQGFAIDMDHAVKGRDVIRFTDRSAYHYNPTGNPAVTDADAEHEHFLPGATVPPELFLVAALEQGDPEVLELQNWEILDVTIPSDIYMVFVGKDNGTDVFELKDVNGTGTGMGMFGDSGYAIRNNSSCKVEVSVIGFDNDNVAANIDKTLMTLVPKTGASANTDLYLGIAAANVTGNGFAMAETSLTAVSGTSPLVMGTLDKDQSGHFIFAAEVGIGFIGNYMDGSYPITGTGSEAQKWMDGTGYEKPGAAAKYQLKYRLQVPDRQRP